jgi:hypothetical protein
MKYGYIKLFRKIEQNKLWLSEKFTRSQAWIDLLLLANHKETFFYIRDLKVTVKRGQIARSQSSLSKRWRWSRGKVIRFLNELEMEQQIVQQKTNVTTVITVLNYAQYQDGSTTDEQQTGQQTGQQTDTYKNNKKEKNIKKEDKIARGNVSNQEDYIDENGFKIYTAPCSLEQVRILYHNLFMSEEKKINHKAIAEDFLQWLISTNNKSGLVNRNNWTASAKRHYLNGKNYSQYQIIDNETDKCLPPKIYHYCDQCSKLWDDCVCGDNSPEFYDKHDVRIALPSEVGFYEYMDSKGAKTNAQQKVRRGQRGNEGQVHSDDQLPARKAIICIEKFCVEDICPALMLLSPVKAKEHADKYHKEFDIPAGMGIEDFCAGLKSQNAK